MTRPLQDIIRECCTECKGACCAGDSQKISELADGWLVFTQGLVLQPDYTKTLIGRLQQEAENVRRYQMTREDKKLRVEAISEFSRFLQGYSDRTGGETPKISPDLVKDISAAAIRFADSPNRETKLLSKSRQNCGFNTPKGCIIPEHNASICKDYFCSSFEAYQSNGGSRNARERIVEAGYGLKDYLGLITPRMPKEEVLDLLRVKVSLIGYHWKQLMVVFNGQYIIDGLDEIAGGRDKLEIIRNPGEERFKGSGNMALLYTGFSVSDKDGLKKLINCMSAMRSIEPFYDKSFEKLGNNRNISRLIVVPEKIEGLFGSGNDYLDPFFLGHIQFVECA
jgi:hypothetical protein